MPSYWLLKTEPGTYSFDRLVEEKRTCWNGIRNYQARNNLRLMAKGDIALIYHSGEDKAVVGVAEIIKEAYPEKDPKGGDWVQVDLKALKKLPRTVSLKELKAQASLSELPLIKHTRLSVMPVQSAHYQRILKLAESQE